MFSSLKSLVTTPFSWFADPTNDSFETEDTPGKRKLVHSPSNPYDSEGDQKDAPSAYRVKRIRLDSPDRVATLPVPPAPTPYLDPPSPSLRPSTHTRTHASKPARPYAPSSNTLPIPRPDTSRLSPLSFQQPPRTQAAPVARTMSMDPPTARRTAIQEPSYLPPPISRDVSMELSPNNSAQPTNPPFRMRSALTPQPGAPLYGPNPQRRERNPSEPPPLTALIENPIFVKAPPVTQDQRRIKDGSNLTLGSLVDTQKPSLSNRSHSTLVLRHDGADGLQPTNAAELALQQLERYRTPLVPTRLGSGNVDVALPELFQARKKARALVLMKRDQRDDKPRLGHASKYINSSKEKDKDTPSKSKNSKPYAGVGGLKKLLARRKQEVIEAKSVEDPDAEAMADDTEREPEFIKHTSKIAEPVRSPATFARKVSAPPPPSSIPSFGLTGRKPAHLGPNRARTVGPTRTRNRFTAAYEDDEPDGADDLAVMPEEPPKGKDSISIGSNLPKFEPPNGFSFAPPPSVTSIPRAEDIPSGRDEPPITALPFTFSKPTTPKITIPEAPMITPVPQPPTIAFVPPTPEGPKTDKPASEPIVPNFFSNSQIFALTGVTPPQTISTTPSKPEPEPVSQVANEPVPVSKPEPGEAPQPSGTSTAPTPATDAVAPASVQSASLETEKPPVPTPFKFDSTPSIQLTSTSTTKQSSSSSSLPFSLTPSAARQLPANDNAGVPPPNPLFGGTIASFPGFGTSVSTPESNTKSTTQSAETTTTSFSFPKVATLAPTESVEPLKPGFSLAQSPSLTSTSASGSALPTEPPKPTGSSTPFSFDQSVKQTTTAAPSTPAKSLFDFSASSITPSTAEKPTGFTFGSSTATPANAPTGLLFGSPASQSETKPAASTRSFPFGTPAPTSSDASKPTFSFGTPTPARTITPPPADDGMRMEESPTRGGGIEVNGGSAKPQSLPQLQMPGTSKPGFSFGTNAGSGFGSPSPSPFGGNSGSGFTFGQQNQSSSQGTSGGFTFGTNTKASESSSGGFPLTASKPAENAPSTGFTFSQSTTDSKPSLSTGFTFSQPGPKTADATSSGFSFKAPEPIQHSTSFTFGQTPPEPARPSSSTGFNFGQTQPQQPATTTPFAFSSPSSGGAFGSAPASPAFGSQQLAPAPSTPFPFAGPTSAPPQQPAPNPFGFGSGAGQPTSPAVQQGFTLSFGGGTPQTPTAPFGASTPQTPATGNSESTMFTMGTTQSPKTVPPGARPVRKLPTRRNANVKR